MLKLIQALLNKTIMIYENLKQELHYLFLKNPLKTELFNYDRAKCNKERERNISFNDALNTFYLRLYGVRHMVKDRSDSEKGNPLPPHRLLFPINSKGCFICTIPHTG